MKIKKYDYKFHLPQYPEASKGYRYEVFSANTDEFVKYANRWDGEEGRIEAIRKCIVQDKDFTDILQNSIDLKPLPHLAQGRGGIADAITGETKPYRRDLSGLCIEDLHFVEPSPSLHYSWLHYCLLRNCRFTRRARDKPGEALFFDSSIQHTRFQGCSFMNITFWSGEYKYIVFAECEFENVLFNVNRDGQYENVIFWDCTFNNVDFSRIDLESFCFSGQCKFNKITVSGENLLRNSKLIGESIRGMMKKWDLEAYRDRNKSIKPIHSTLRKVKYQTVAYCYSGLSQFYKAMSVMEEAEGFHGNYIKWQYLYSFSLGEYRLMKYGWKSNISELISRYLTGYGTKPIRPFFAWSLVNSVFAFLYLFSGIRHQSDSIHRILHFNPSKLGGTLRDLGTCLYFSTITSTTVGYGDISPESGWSMLFCATHAVLGMALLTLFTVILAKRFFK